MNSKRHGVVFFHEAPGRGRLLRLASRIALAAVLVACLPEPISQIFACDACSNQSCTSGLEQGTYGCSEGVLECNFIERFLFGCNVRYCSTQDQPPCDNRFPRGARPSILMSATPSGSCPAGTPSWASLESSGPQTVTASPAPTGDGIDPIQ